MSSQSDPRLDQAQRLIESEQFEAARALLIGILRENSRDTRALFLYSLAAANRDEAIKVLNRILQLDPLNQNAKNALARLEGRRVESESASPSPPSQVAPARRDDPLVSSGDVPKKSSGGYDSTILLAMAAVVIVIGAAIGALVVMGSGEDEPAVVAATASNTPFPSNTPLPTNTPDLDALATFEAVSNATLPPSWTPIPTGTLQPTRTPGPTFGVQASATLMPTFTPTQPQVVQIPINLQSFSRLFNEYYELSAQASFVEDSRSLGRIAVALDTIVESLETSNYNSVENDPDLVSYAEEFIVLLNRERDLTQKRAEIVDLNDALASASDADRGELDQQLGEASEDLESLQLQRLEQLELVESRLRAMGSNAADAAADAAGEPSGPTTTPIIVPTAPEAGGGDEG